MNNKILNPIISLIVISIFLISSAMDLMGQTTVQRKLYLSAGATLDRVDPVAAMDMTLDSSAVLVKSEVLPIGTPNSEVNQASNSGVDSFLYTVPTTGVNRVLIVAIASEATAGIPPISLVKFGNVDLTLLQESSDGSSRIQLWYLLNPTTGDGQVKYYWTAASTIKVVAGATCFANVTQTNTSPFNNTQLASGISGNSGTVTVSSNSGDMVVDVISRTGANGFATLVGQTLSFKASTSAISGGSSYKVATGASTTMNWSWGERQQVGL